MSGVRRTWLPERHAARPLLTALLALVLAACGQGATTAPTAAPEASQPTVAPEAAGPTARPRPGPGEFINPIVDRDFPDPDVLKVGDTYYAYATNSGVANIQGLKSTDLIRWQLLPGVLPVMPEWSRPGLTWAPEVTTWDDGQSFVMYFTARDLESDKQCIGIATAEKPEGPFFGVGDGPLICQADLGGSIDAAAFRDDDGTPYLLWKNDGNCCGRPVHLYLQQVAPDGLTLVGEPVELITNDKLWEGNLVEAPTLWKHEGQYFLFYSANSYAGIDYAVGYAVADSITGPYVKPGDDPFLSTDFGVGAALGPGGQDIIVDADGETWMMYHSWDPSNSYRRVNIEELDWEGGRPVLRGPDPGPQPVP
jgi:beta-xylosidase